MKAGIWGAGNIANAHAEALRSSGVELAAVTAHNLETAKEFAERWRVPVYGTDPAIFEDEEIKSVHICTPPALRFSLIENLLKNNKHVLCEKPLSIDSDEAYELKKLAENSNLVTAVDLNVRYMSSSQKAKELLETADYGPIKLMHGTYLQQFEVLPTPYSWRHQAELAGRMHAVTEIGTHWLDLAQYLSSRKITRVNAIFSLSDPRYVKDGLMHSSPQGDDSVEVDLQAEEIALVHIQFSDGSLGALTLSQISSGRMNHLEMEITGTKGNIWWDSTNPTLLYNATKEGGVIRECVPFGNNGFNDSIRKLIQDFYSAIENRDRPRPAALPTFADAAYLCAICDAIYQSAMKGGVWLDVSEFCKE